MIVTGKKKGDRKYNREKCQAPCVDIRAIAYGKVIGIE